MKEVCLCVHKPSGLSAPGCSGGAGGLPPVSAGSDGWSGSLAAVRQTHSGRISLHLPHWAKKNTCRNTQVNTQIKSETDRLEDELQIKCPRGTEQPAFSMKGSLKVHVHTEIHDVLMDLCWFEHKFFARGDLDKLTRQKPHTSFLLPVSVWTWVQAGLKPSHCAWSTQHTVSILLCLGSTNAVSVQLQHDSKKVPHPLSLYYLECNETNDVMKLFK